MSPDSAPIQVMLLYRSIARTNSNARSNDSRTSSRAARRSPRRLTFLRTLSTAPRPPRPLCLPRWVRPARRYARSASGRATTSSHATCSRRMLHPRVRLAQHRDIVTMSRSSFARIVRSAGIRLPIARTHSTSSECPLSCPSRYLPAFLVSF